MSMEKELTQEEIQAYEEKAIEIAKKYSCAKVHPVVQINPDTLERAVCYLKEPNYMTQIAIMDKAAQMQIYSAAEELRQAIIIKDESDPITYGDGPESSPYKLGVLDRCLQMIGRYTDQFKKK